nr:ubiquitin-like-conjugating enzyme ATG10 isoform X1 [Ipomoea batatas]
MSSEKSIIDIKSWDGTISFGEFYAAACAFAEQWKKFSSSLPQWSWVKCPKPHGVPATSVSHYTYFACFCHAGPFDIFISILDYSILQIFNQSSSQSDVSLLKVQQHKHERCHYDFHVVYSLSYRVPVLYFCAYWSDGQPLALGDVENGIPASTLRELNVSKWTFITQEEHPYLNRPWFTLHPCGTSEWMKLLFTSDASAVTLGRVAVDRYLVSWFSVVAQVFGLKLPFEMLSNSCQP